MRVVRASTVTVGTGEVVRRVVDAGHSVPDGKLNSCRPVNAFTGDTESGISIRRETTS